MKHSNLFKRGIVALLMMAMLLSCFAGCSSKSGSSGQTAPETTKAPENASGTEGTTAAADEVVNHAKREGLPIADEEITLVVGVKAPVAAYQGPWEDLEWVHKLEEAAGVKLEFKAYSTTEDINLMFTGKDYPDISFNIGSDKQIQDAALGGDVLALDDLIKEWAPNWDKLFTEDDLARKTCTMDDGHIYSLPMIRSEPSICNLRDQWLINKSWLDELGLPVPTTTDEFYNTLKAFKENAGKGSIPEDVIPYYVYGITTNIGGALDMFNAFGCRVSGETYMATIDDDGKVEFNYISDGMKEPLLFLRKLFEEGLIPYECLTDNNDTYLVKTRSNPAIVGSFHSFQNPDPTNQTVVAMAPLDSGNGKTPMIRSQTNQITRNYFTIYSNCKYPEVAMRLADLIADPDWSVQGMYGMFGDTYTQKNDDGTYTILAYPADGQGATSAPMNRVPLMITDEVASRLKYADGSGQAQRNNALEDVYKDYVIPFDNMYPKTILFTVEQTDRLAELKKDLSDCMKNTFSTWMLEGGIEEGWDDYVAQMHKLGVDEYIAILQDALDNFNAK